MCSIINIYICSFLMVSSDMVFSVYPVPSSDDYINIIFTCLTAAFVTYLAIPKIIHFANTFRLYDSGGERSAHEGAVPIFGGVAIFSGIIFSLLLWSKIAHIQFLLVSMVIVFFVGIIDDLLALSPLKKIIGQIIAIVVLIHLGNFQIDSMHGVLGVYELSPLMSTLFTIFTVIVVTNGFNLIDGADGLSSGLGIISSLCFSIMAVLASQIDMAIIGFALFGALLGFLRFNWHPARIFMGDTGSLVVGLILSILAINMVDTGLIYNSEQYPNKGPLLAIAILAIPLFDSLRVFIVRMFKGMNPLSADKGHIHHALIDLGFSHKQTSLLICVVNFLMFPLAIFIIKLNVNYSIIILAAINFILLYFPFLIRKLNEK